MINVSLIEYSMIKYEPRLLAAGALYLAYTIERKANQRKYSQNSSHTISSNHSMVIKSKDSIGIESSMKFISILCAETDKSENDIKRWAIDVNVCKKAYGESNKCS